MKAWITVLLLSGILFAGKSLAQAGEYISLEKVPEVVQEKFLLLYPEAEMRTAQWEYEYGGYEAYIKDEQGNTTDIVFFKADGRLDYRILTDGKGWRTGTEREIPGDSLPEQIRTQILEAQPGKTCKVAVERLDKDGNVVAYRVVLEDEILEFDVRGEPKRE